MLARDLIVMSTFKEQHKVLQELKLEMQHMLGTDSMRSSPEGESEVVAAATRCWKKHVHTKC